jgi:hypothetical protein
MPILLRVPTRSGAACAEEISKTRERSCSSFARERGECGAKPPTAVRVELLLCVRAGVAQAALSAREQ